MTSVPKIKVALKGKQRGRPVYSVTAKQLSVTRFLTLFVEHNKKIGMLTSVFAKAESLTAALKSIAA